MRRFGWTTNLPSARKWFSTLVLSGDDWQLTKDGCEWVSSLTVREMMLADAFAGEFGGSIDELRMAASAINTPACST